MKLTEVPFNGWTDTPHRRFPDNRPRSHEQSYCYVLRLKGIYEDGQPFDIAKVGLTADPFRRCREIANSVRRLRRILSCTKGRTADLNSSELLYIFKGGRECEKFLHKELLEFRQYQKWLVIASGGGTESFLAEASLAKLRKLLGNQ